MAAGWLLAACASARPETPDVKGIDHLVYASAELERGMAEIEALLGARPVRGGRHPAYGTHNALLSLGPSTYLEVIAPDPELPRPERGVLFGEAAADGSRLVTWVARTEAIEDAAERLRAEGFEPGPVDAGRRQRPDGSTLGWRLTDPYALCLGGAVPFLIAWGETPHPSGAVPSGGRLVRLTIEHRRPADVRRALAAIGVQVDVRAGDRVRLTATIETERGAVELR